MRPDALYAVKPRYPDLEDEGFRVSFLGHESQHYADNERFPGLPSWQLEYRAKLAELVMANASRAKLVAAFASNMGNDPEVPHSYANRVVLAALRERLRLAPGADLATAAPEMVRSAALAALRESSRELNARGVD